MSNKWIWESLTVSMETGEFIDGRGYWYDGPIDECKKGREQQDQAIRTSQDIEKHNQAVQDASRAQADPYARSLMSTAPGQLSPYAKAQYASDLRNIGDTYGSIREGSLRGLSYRGMGNAPTGMEASIVNSADRAKGGAETEAYNRAQQNTLGEGLEGIKYFGQQQDRYNPLPANEQTSVAAARRGQMGSTFGDIMGGIGTLASGAGSVMTGMGSLRG